MDDFLRGRAWPADDGLPYPRADPVDRWRLPGDTWTRATFPVGVRLEFTGDASGVRIRYRCAGDADWFREPPEGTRFELWAGDDLLAQEPAVAAPGDHDVELIGGDASSVRVVYLPDGLRPELLAVEPVGGTIAPAPAGPRWLAYGDSITEGWLSSSPAGCWPAIVARRLGVDVVNLGYAGSARGEVASAEQIAALPTPDVISIAFGTNCWSRLPYSTAMLAATTTAFITLVRQGHPETPIVVLSLLLRPEGEAVPNKLGATVADLRAAVEEAAIDAGVALVPGLDIVTAAQLPDGLHPDDHGHAAVASAMVPAIARALGREA